MTPNGRTFRRAAQRGERSRNSTSQRRVCAQIIRPDVRRERVCDERAPTSLQQQAKQVSRKHTHDERNKFIILCTIARIKWLFFPPRKKTKLRNFFRCFSFSKQKVFCGITRVSIIRHEKYESNGQVPGVLTHAADLAHELIQSFIDETLCNGADPRDGDLSMPFRCFAQRENCGQQQFVNGGRCERFTK